jgi:hypothetical protein
VHRDEHAPGTSVGAGVRGQIGGGMITRTTVSGELLYVTMDGVQQFLVRDTTGTLVPLGSEYRPPEVDSGGVTPVLPGASVELVGGDEQMLDRCA